MTTVLITGATGFVGSHTARELACSGFKVRLLVRDPARAHTYCEKNQISVEKFIKGDISNFADMQEAVKGCDALIHAAAIVGLTGKDAKKVAWNNIEGTRNVMHAALTAGLGTIIYVSSATALYSAGLDCIDETCQPGSATSGYGFSKTECERYVRELQQRGAPIIITYPTGVIGPDDPKLSGSVSAIRGFLRDLLPITTSGIQLVDVRDVACLHRDLLRRGVVQNDLLQNRVVAGGTFLSWPDLARAIETLTGRRPRTAKMSPIMMKGLGFGADFLRRFVDVDAPISAEAMRYAYACIEARSRHDLMRHRDVQTSLRDTIVWLVASGHLPVAFAGDLSP